MEQRRKCKVVKLNSRDKILTFTEGRGYALSLSTTVEGMEGDAGNLFWSMLQASTYRIQCPGELSLRDKEQNKGGERSALCTQTQLLPFKIVL